MIIQFFIFFNNNLTNDKVLLVKYFPSRQDGRGSRLENNNFLYIVLKFVSDFRIIIIFETEFV